MWSRGPGILKYMKIPLFSTSRLRAPRRARGDPGANVLLYPPRQSWGTRAEPIFSEQPPPRCGLQQPGAQPRSGSVRARSRVSERLRCIQTGCGAPGVLLSIAALAGIRAPSFSAHLPFPPMGRSPLTRQQILHPAVRVSSPMVSTVSRGKTCTRGIRIENGCSARWPGKMRGRGLPHHSARERRAAV